MNGDIVVKRIDPKAWKEMAENAHIAVFSESWDRELERIDFALIMVSPDSNTLISYATAQRVDSSTVYLQYGGSFPSFKGTPLSFLSFREMLLDLKKDFSKIVTLVENKNYPMLKFYMKEFFLITGIRYFNGHVFLENTYEAFS